MQSERLFSIRDCPVENNFGVKEVCCWRQNVFSIFKFITSDYEAYLTFFTFEGVVVANNLGVMDFVCFWNVFFFTKLRVFVPLISLTL